eukprot:SAG25_NODE_5723_length_626_cov_1.333966_2_plen_77_part_00
MLDFRKGLKGLAADNEGFYKHVFGYSGRSQAQGVVERLNGTLKRLLFRHLNFKSSVETGRIISTKPWKTTTATRTA